jgi:serine/threonine protein kinase
MTSLAAGTKLGPYEVLSPIGAGEMGEVWKARDTRLGRIVAIKMVKEQHSGVNPLFDPLRSHPRYHALLRKMNLEP